MIIYYLPDCPGLDREYGFKSYIVCSKCGKTRWLTEDVENPEIFKAMPTTPNPITYRIDSSFQVKGQLFDTVREEEIYLNFGKDKPDWLWQNRPFCPEWWWDHSSEALEFCRNIANIPDKKMGWEGWFKVYGIEVDKSNIPVLEEACQCIGPIRPLSYKIGVGFEP